MRSKLLPLAVLFGLLFLSSCGSKAITTADIREQEAEALEEIAEAQEEATKLAEMKEKYSADKQESDLATLRQRKAEIEKDLNRLRNLQTDDAVGDTETLIQKLRAKSQEVDIMMAEIKKKPKENWEAAVDSIEISIGQLKQEVARIMDNVPDVE